MEELEEFGLTKYESKVYLTLLSGGISDARSLSIRSGVPFGRIYDVLASLESKGLVEKQVSRPKKFLAVEPKIALKRLLDLKREEMKSLVDKARKVEEKLNRNLNQNFKAQKESLFWNVAIGSDVIGKHMERLEEAEKELFAYAELHEYMIDDGEKRIWMNEFLRVISGLIERGVSVKLLIGCNDTGALKELTPLITPFLSLLEKMEIRVVSTVSTPFDVIDGEKVQLKVRNPARPEEYFASVYVWQRGFAEELKDRFREMWKGAKDFRIRVE
jgi:sugar-specific transcriptional regulator TrmB